jgi:hypothetical protein
VVMCSSAGALLWTLHLVIANKSMVLRYVCAGLCTSFSMDAMRDDFQFVSCLV